MKPCSHSSDPIKIPVTFMRGGTSKGLFFCLSDLPKSAQSPGEERDHLLLRIMGSPDAYGKQIDGMGGGSSSTSKVAIISRSELKDHDVDYLFGQVSIDKPFIDWSGNCGNLTAAVGAYALNQGLIEECAIPENGIVSVRIWQKNIEKTIVVEVPISNHKVLEVGEFHLDGVAFPSSEIKVDYLKPVDKNDLLFPTGSLIDTLNVPGVGSIDATLIYAGIPTIFINAKDIGLIGIESQSEINNNLKILRLFESIRAEGALKMGLIRHLDEAIDRQHSPKIAFVSPPQPYKSSGGKEVESGSVDLVVRAVSMGKLHHAIMGTAAVAVAVAATIPGTIVNQVIGGLPKDAVRFGHPSGVMSVGVQAENNGPHWQVSKVTMSRSARVLMEGWVRVPPDLL